MKPFRKTYRLTHVHEERRGVAEFISDDHGRRGYLRIEAASGEYVGSLDGAALVALARTILRAYAKPGRRSRGGGRP